MVNKHELVKNDAYQLNVRLPDFVFNAVLQFVDVEIYSGARNCYKFRVIVNDNQSKFPWAPGEIYYLDEKGDDWEFMNKL